jgi:3-phytase/alkaline phosphatase D
VAIVAIVLCGLLKPAMAQTIGLSLIGVQSLPTSTKFEGLPFGGISGLDRLPDGRFVAISDSRGGNTGVPRFYTLALDYDGYGFHGVRILGQHSLRQADGQAYGQAYGSEPAVDAEDIRLLPNGNLLWASEGVWHADAKRRHQPFVREMRPDGSPVRDLALPPAFGLVDKRRIGGRSNKSIEALAVTPKGIVYAANEEALIQDGPVATPANGSWLRWVAFDPASGAAGAQHAYALPPVPAAGLPGAPFGPDNGLVALLALDEQNFIGVERAYAFGVGNTIRLVALRITAETTDVRHMARLTGARVTPIERRLLLELTPRWQGLAIDNIEAISWGHRLADGRPTLVLASDNNFNPLQTSQFIVLALDGVDGPNAAGHAATGPHGVAAPDAADPRPVRFATFNASLNRDASGDLLADLANPTAQGAEPAVARRIQQVRHVAEILQRIQADVLLVNEFDLDLDGKPGAGSQPLPAEYSSRAAALFQQNFLAVPQGHPARGMAAPIRYAHRHTPNTNTGLPSGLDLDRNGQVVSTPHSAGYGNDALGFGQYAGQYGMTVYSKYPILSVRSFQNFDWASMPGNLLQNDPSPEAQNLSKFYPPEAVQRLKLSSKNHVDLALCIRGQAVHFLVSHPTPPAFDGPEDRNGKRNHDEIRLWADYIAGADYLVDDQGRRGGLAPGARFVIAGDLNADPFDGDSFARRIGGRSVPAIMQLLSHPLVNARVVPQAPGGVDARDHPSNNGDANARHRGDPAHDTADFNDAAPGNLRVDYVLPSANWHVLGAGIFWPADPDRTAPNTSGHVFDLVGHFRDQGLYANFPSSDHRAVWLDLQLPRQPGAGQGCRAPGDVVPAGAVPARR